MCGIFGHTCFSEETLNRSREALNTLIHRGPDQWGEWYDSTVFIGHRRLSILDLSENGRQPMTDEDHQLVITVNGEIYNFKELREQIKHQYHFKSESDSEIVLYGYKAWGIERLLNLIDGMYAFCVYDKTRQKIFLARDRVGIKPLYYATLGNLIVWASELKAIECFCKENLDVDHTAIYDFLTYSYIPAPKTMYKNVFKLEPAHYLEIDIRQNSVTNHCYWELQVAEKSVSLEDAASQLRYLVQKSVREQLMSDVPVGFFLSGGMDSSVVVAEASGISNKIHTYSIGFDVETHSETHYADIVARHFQTNHNKKILNHPNVTR